VKPLLSLHLQRERPGLALADVSGRVQGEGEAYHCERAARSGWERRGRAVEP